MAVDRPVLVPSRLAADRLRRVGARGTWLAVILLSLTGVRPPAGLAQRVEISQQLFDQHGDPLLVAVSAPQGRKGVMRWRVCAPQAACVPVASKRSFELIPGPTAPGTRFAVTLDYRGHVTRDISNPWQGRVTAVALPALTGRTAVGAIVRTRGASWTGGWGGEFDELRIEACRTPMANRCETVSAPFALGQPATAAAEARISPWYAGWYVQALDARLAADTVFGRPGFVSPLAVPPLVRDSTVAVSPPVPIAGAAPEIPRVRLRGRVARVRHRLVFGTVSCTRCHVTLNVIGSAVLDRRITVRGHAALAIGRARRLRPGRIYVTVRFEEHELAARQERLARRG